MTCDQRHMTRVGGRSEACQEIQPTPPTGAERSSPGRRGRRRSETGYHVLLIVIGVLYGLAFVTGLRRRPAPLPG